MEETTIIILDVCIHVYKLFQNEYASFKRICKIE